MATGSETPETTGEKNGKNPGLASVLVPVAVILAVVLVALGFVNRHENAEKADSAGQPGAESADRRAVGRVLPDVELLGTDGKKTKLSALPGKVIVLNFWATWCGPCVSEMPALQKLADTYKDRGLSVVGINVDEDWEKVLEPFRKRNQITFPSYVDPKSELSDAFGISGLPLTLVIGPGRKLLFEKMGAEEWFDDPVRKQFERWLEEAAKGGGA
jgi:thiol-disulfide isomerase/thioredoxin